MRLDIRIVSVTNFPRTELIGAPDPYCEVRLIGPNEREQKYKTQTIDDCLLTTAVFNCLFSFQITEPSTAYILITLRNANLLIDDDLGIYKLKLDGLTRGIVSERKVFLQNCKVTTCELAMRILAVDFGIPPTVEQVQAACSAAGGQKQQPPLPPHFLKPGAPPATIPVQLAPAYSQQHHHFAEPHAHQVPTYQQQQVPFQYGAAPPPAVPYPQTDPTAATASASFQGQRIVRPAQQQQQQAAHVASSSGYPMPPGGFVSAAPISATTTARAIPSVPTISGYGVVHGPTGSTFGSAPKPQALAYPMPGKQQSAAATSATGYPYPGAAPMTTATTTATARALPAAAPVTASTFESGYPGMSSAALPATAAATTSSTGYPLPPGGFANATNSSSRSLPVPGYGTTSGPSGSTFGAAPIAHSIAYGAPSSTSAPTSAPTATGAGAKTTNNNYQNTGLKTF